MAKTVHNDVLDAALNVIKNDGDAMYLCNAEPTTYTEATATFALAGITGLTSGDYTGPADGDTNGRKLTVDAQNGDTVDTSGTVTHVAIVDVSLTKLLYVTEVTSQVLTAGNTVNYGAWDIEIADPT